MADFARLPLDRVKAGPLAAGLYEPGRGDRPARLLLAAGAAVDDAVLARLKTRGVTEVVVDRRRLDAVRVPDPGAPADAPAREPVPPAEGRPTPRDALVRELTRPTGPVGPDRARAAAARRDAVAERVGDLFRGAAGAAAVDGAALRDLSVQSVAGLAEDFDLFARLGLAPFGTRRPAAADRLREHAVRTAHLALAVGCVLGLRRDELECLATGCLVHDIGMTRVDAALWDSPRRLSRVEFLEVAKHPLHTLDLLAGVPEVPAAARAVALQLHERADGSGYPRGRGGERVHRLARVAAVADAYCGMTADRPHRPALAPHAALRRLAAGTLRGTFDAEAVRAFLETVSAFPLGSTVRLADGRCGRVIQARRGRPAEPRVELWDPLAGRFTGETLDLSAGGPRVVAADEPLPLAFSRAA